MLYNKYRKHRIHKNYMSKSEYKNIQNMINSVDYESQILGFSLLKQTKTIKHYRYCQMCKVKDLTRRYDDDVKIYKDIDLMINDIIGVLKIYKKSIHVLMNMYNQIIVRDCQLKNLYIELNLWLQAHLLP